MKNVYFQLTVAFKRFLQVLVNRALDESIPKLKSSPPKIYSKTWALTYILILCVFENQPIK